MEGKELPKRTESFGLAVPRESIALVERPPRRQGTNHSQSFLGMTSARNDLTREWQIQAPVLTASATDFATYS